MSISRGAPLEVPLLPLQQICMGLRALFGAAPPPPPPPPPPLLAVWLPWLCVGLVVMTITLMLVRMALAHTAAEQ